MAGSIKHCLTDEGTYRGTALLENMRDMEEGVEEMMFFYLTVKNILGGDAICKEIMKRYYRCLRGKEPWPEFMRPGIER